MVLSSPAKFRSLQDDLEDNSKMSSILNGDLAATPPGEQSRSATSESESGTGTDEPLNCNLYGYEEEDGYAPYWNDNVFMADGRKWPNSGVAL